MPVKPRGGPRLVLQPASRLTARHASTSALKRFFAIAEAWELSPLQQCRLLKIPSPQVLERYRLGQAREWLAVPGQSAPEHVRPAGRGEGARTGERQLDMAMAPDRALDARQQPGDGGFVHLTEEGQSDVPGLPVGPAEVLAPGS